jgi:hypothetical protein
MTAGTNNPVKLDPRTLAGAALSLELDALPEELPVTVWLPGPCGGMVEIIAAVQSTIYVNGKPRPAIGLITARES